MLWLALHFPMLGLEERMIAFAPQDPSPCGGASSPAILVADNKVVQANETARQAGIVPGCTLATAHSVLPDIVHFHHEPTAACRRLALLGQLAYRYSAKVSLSPPDALLLEVRGSLRLFGGLKALAAGLAAESRRFGHTQNVAAATTPSAALVLARAGSGNISEDTTEQPIQALHGVPLVHADLSPKCLERLANMGITRMEKLLMLPTRELGKRFGPALIDYLARLTGRKADPRKFIEPLERFRSGIHLLEPVRGKDALLFPMSQLATELAGWLASRQFGVRVLTWTMKPLSGPAAVLTVEFAQPRMDDRSFLTLSKLKLASAILPGEVMSVSLRAGFVAPFVPVFADLLEMADHSTASRAELVDLLAAKLGGEAVRNLRAIDDHRPEHAWSSETAGRQGTIHVAPDDRTAKGFSRPMWLFNPPKPVDAKRFEMLSGPERIETGWWDSRSLFRDYYIALSEQGARCWLYREQDERWYLHGYFS